MFFSFIKIPLTMSQRCNNKIRFIISGFILSFISSNTHHDLKIQLAHTGIKLILSIDYPVIAKVFCDGGFSSPAFLRPFLDKGL